MTSLERGPRGSPERFSGVSARIEQTTTRGDGAVEQGGPFRTEDIDFGGALEHLTIHHGGEVAGSQFNGELFATPADVQELVQKLLPETRHYDQYDRAELTLTVSLEGDKPIGYTGVRSVAELRKLFPAVPVESAVRTPGGLPAEEEGLAGAWYPEMERDPSGKWVIARDAVGNVKNLQGKFEPRANIATIPAETFREAARTNTLTVIIQKDRETQRPMVLTIFPGGNAPAFPAKIQTADYQANTLGNSLERRFWDERVFLRPQPTG